MARKAIIDADGNVLNVIAVPDDWKGMDLPSGQSVIDADEIAEPRGSYKDGSFTKPPAQERPRKPTLAEKLAVANARTDRLEAALKSKGLIADGDIAPTR